MKWAAVVTNSHIKTDVVVCKTTEAIVKQPWYTTWSIIISKVQAETNRTYLYPPQVVQLGVRQEKDPMLKWSKDHQWSCLGLTGQPQEVIVGGSGEEFVALVQWALEWKTFAAKQLVRSDKHHLVFFSI